MIRLQCPDCQKKLGVKDDLAGRLVACPQCKARIRVPQAELDELEEVDEAPVKSISTAPRPGRPRPVPKTRPRDEEEEEPEAVRRPRRPRDEDEDDEEEPRPRPARKRKMKRRIRRADSDGGMSGLLITLGVIGGISLIMIVVSFFVPVLSFVPIAVGWLLSIAGGIWFLVCAFQDDVVQGLLCMFLPLYSLIYLINHFEEVKKPFFVQIVGTVLLIGGGCAGGIRAAKEVDGLNRTRVQVLVVPCSSIADEPEA